MSFPLSGCIIVNRENFIPTPLTGLSDIDIENFNLHFSNRAKAEDFYFGKYKDIYPSCPKFIVENNLNSLDTVSFLNSVNPDLVLIFGSGMIKEPLFSSLPKQTINLHLGLSPRYRGAATLFWPFYFLEPQFAGSTFHYITNQPDAGDIIHQVLPTLEYGDKIHDVACKIVIESSNAALRLIQILNESGNWKKSKQKTSGKNFLEKDFIPAHLRLVYNTFNDRIVDAYLENKIGKKLPNIYKQF